MTAVALATACTLVLAASGSGIASGIASTDDPVIPADSNVTNVLDWGLKGDGKTDNAAALAHLFNHSTPLSYFYFPEGTYLLSKPIKTHTRGDCLTDFTILAGAGQGKTTIRFQDSIPDAQDPTSESSRAAVISLGCSPAQNFHDAIQDLTISTGSKNPGAVGLRFNANNVGWIRRVTIRSEDSNAAIGLDQSFSDQIGPMITTDVTITGFDIGLAISKSVDSLAYERVTIEDPKYVGVLADEQVAFFRRIVVKGNPSVAAFAVPLANSAVTIIDSEFECPGAASCSAPAMLLNTNISLEDSFWPSEDGLDDGHHDMKLLRAGTDPAAPAPRELYQLPTCQTKSYGCWSVTSPNNIFQCMADCPSGSGLTIEKCMGCCSGKGYQYLALGGGCACHCFHDFETARNASGATDAPPDKCDTPCDGDKKETCGGAMAMSILSKDFEPCFRNNTVDPENVQTVVFARNISLTGYPTGVANVTGLPGNLTTTALVKDTDHIDEFASVPAVVLIPDARGNTSMGLPVEETPTFEEPDKSKWANAAKGCNASYEHPAYKSGSLYDCSASFQAALDSGATTVYWPQPGDPPRGKGIGAPVYWLLQDVHIPKTVRRVVGFMGGYGGALMGNGSICIDEGDENDPPVIFDRLTSPLGGSHSPLNYWHRSKRAVAFRDYSGLATDSVWHPEWNTSVRTGGYNNGTLPDWTPGAVYLDDVVGGPFYFHKQNVWARQLNTENFELDVLNSGGNLWLLGLKTEKGTGGLVHTVNGGKTEILGVFAYDTEHTPITVPVFYADETSSLSATFQLISEMHKPENLGFVNMVTQGTKSGNVTLVHNSPDAGYVPRDGSQGAVALYAGVRK